MDPLIPQEPQSAPDQWQQDAFGQVDALLRALNLRQ